AIVGCRLRAVELLAHGVDGDADAAPVLIASIGIAAASLDQRLDLRAVEIDAHHAHALAVAPIELAVRLIEMDLLRRERTAGRDDDPAIAAVEIGALDRAVVDAGDAHVGPIDMARRDIHHDAVAEAAIGHDCPLVRAVGVHQMNAPGIELEHEQAAGSGGGCRVFCRSRRWGYRRWCGNHRSLLLVRVASARATSRGVTLRMLKTGWRSFALEIRRAIAPGSCTTILFLAAAGTRRVAPSSRRRSMGAILRVKD